MTSAANQRPAAPTAAVPDRLHRANAIRDPVAGSLVVLGAALPWNLYFGIGIAGTSGWVFGLLVLAALMALAAVVLTHVGPFSIHSPSTDLKSLDRMRLVLTIPYLIMAIGFVVFAVVQSIRTGGSVAVPPGIGPGAWLGVAGALLSSAPVITGADDSDRRGMRSCRDIGIVSLVLAVAAVLFNLYWRTRFVAPNIGDADTGAQNLVVVVAAVLYGIVALLPVVIATRWMMSTTQAGGLATVMLAMAVLVAGVFVWLLPLGRDLDAFHGIAQSTSTAGVGFEGYLAWVAAAAIIASATLLAALGRNSAPLRRTSARKCLGLIAVWCAGSALLRIVDLMTSSVLDLPAPPYNGTALMAFDLVAAVVAAWLFINGSSTTSPRLLLRLLCGILFVLTVCRLIVGVALVPGVQPLDAAAITAVYGNTLAQQITSTFDVALCVLALALLIIAFMTGGEAAKKTLRQRAAAAHATPEVVVPAGQSTPTAAVPSDQWARPVAKGSDPSAPTIAMSGGAPDGVAGTAKIFRSESRWTHSATDRVDEVLAESTQRFAAGTTYGAGVKGQSQDTPDAEPQ